MRENVIIIDHGRIKTQSQPTNERSASQPNHKPKSATHSPTAKPPFAETPRACLRADRIVAAGADFFSFGSNDLTGFTLGFSRDDAEQKFLPAYLKAGIIPCDPFESLDEAGVGELIQLAIERGRAARPGLEVGLCGEHGGDARSIAFLAAAGLGYVSVSPPRVPVARLAAAQAAVRTRAAAGRGDGHCQE